jgi:hypothetical protein
MRLDLLIIDIDHIGDRQMTRIANHAFAIVIALVLTAVSFQQLVAIPAGGRTSPVEIA